MNDRIEQAVPLILAAVKPAVKEALSEEIKEHYSENDWDRIVEVAAERMSLRLIRDFKFGEFITQSSMFTAEGRVNVDGMIAAFQSVIDAGIKSGDEGKLKHLMQYMRHTADNLKLHRR